LKSLTIYKRVVRAVIKYNPLFNEARFSKAYYLAKETFKGEKALNDKLYLNHPLSIAYRLSSLKVDEDTLIATMIHRVMYKDNSLEKTILDEFGQDVLDLVKNVIRVDNIKVPEDMEEKQMDGLRKLYLSISNDLRVVLIKTAERLHELEMLDETKDVEMGKKLARETLLVHVPITDILGIWDLKWRLEDLSFKFLNEVAYNSLLAEITDSKDKMESYIRRVTYVIEKELTNEGLTEFSISGRVKNLYSIYKKIVYKNKSLDEIYDIIAIRIVLNSQTDCYRVLGIVHNFWRPLTDRIKDYIAVPKINGYRSLHTTIFCLDNHLTEIQIRTKDMHEEAEFGMAAHLVYGQRKMAFIPSEIQQRWIASLKNIKFQDDLFKETDVDYKKKLKVDVFQDHIFVFTPKGHVKDLPKGATPIDFAYSVHTDLGKLLKGAKVNGKMVPLSTQLDNGDIVEILTREDGSGPKREWLGNVKTSKAKTKIKAYLKQQKRDEYVKAGKEILEQELTKIDKKIDTYHKKKLVTALPYEEIEDIYAAIGEGGLSLALVLKKAFPEVKRHDQNTKKEDLKKKKKGTVVIEGLSGLSTRVAQCCNPKVGDKVKGYSTIGRGISIHHESCPIINKVDPKRVFNASYE